MKTQNTYKPQEPVTAHPTDENTIVPAWHFMTETLCEEFRDAGMHVNQAFPYMEVDTENQDGIALQLSDDSRELSAWTSIILAAPNSTAERAVALNALNEKSFGARFSQNSDEDVINVAQNHLIGKEGLSASTALRFIQQFAEEVERAEEVLAAAGFFDEPSGSTESAYGEGAMHVSRKDLDPINTLPRPL
jgi:hypothetical protein